MPTPVTEARRELILAFRTVPEGSYAYDALLELDSEVFEVGDHGTFFREGWDHQRLTDTLAHITTKETHP